MLDPRVQDGERRRIVIANDLFDVLRPDGRWFRADLFPVFEVNRAKLVVIFEEGAAVNGTCADQSEELGKRIA